MKRLWFALTVGALAFWACDDSASSASSSDEVSVETSSSEEPPESSSEKAEAESSVSEKSKAKSSSSVTLSSSEKAESKSSSSKPDAKSSSAKDDVVASSSSKGGSAESSAEPAPKSSSSKSDAKSSSAEAGVVASSSSMAVESSAELTPESSSERVPEQVSSSSVVPQSSSEAAPADEPDVLVEVNKFGYAIGVCGGNPFDTGVKALAKAKAVDDVSLIEDVQLKKGYLLDDGNNHYQVMLPEASDYCDVEAKVKMKRDSDTLFISYDFGETGFASKCRCLSDHWFDIDPEYADVKYVSFENELFEIVEK